MERQKLQFDLNTFTASFPDLSIDETTYVKKLSALYSFSDHYTYPDSEKLWEEMNTFLWHQELPVQSTSPFAQWEVMKLAHQYSVKVLLDGQGMDEILGGYSEFIGAFLLGQLSGGHLLKFIKSLKDLGINYKTSSVSSELYRAAFYYLPGFLRYKMYSVNRIGPSIINKEYNNVAREIKFTRRISNSVSETSLMSIRNILPVLLRYEDRNSMAFSVESRVPYLDHRLVEFCVSLPDNIKIYQGWTKYVLRKCMEPYLPAEITWRKEKLGFVTPENTWIVKLKSVLIEYIRNQPIPDIINSDEIIKKVTKGLSSNIQLGEIWKIILFVKWYNVFFKGN